MSEIKKFDWTDDLSVGVEAMDNQHKIIIKKINSLIEGLNSSDLPTIEKNFSDLASYVVSHFEDEEVFWRDGLWEGFGS